MYVRAYVLSIVENNQAVGHEVFLLNSDKVRNQQRGNHLTRQKPCE
jgi:hypothetical protein